MINNIFKADDGVNHWLICETEDQAEDLMKVMWKETVGEGSEDYKEHEEYLSIKKLDPEEEMSYTFDMGKDSLTLRVRDWINLYELFVHPKDRKPLYWACSEW